jgi:hypothetical protein
MKEDSLDGEDDSFSETCSAKMAFLDQWKNSNTEMLLKEWGEKAAGLRWMHRYSANHWRSVDKRLNVVGMSISSVISATSLIGAAESFIPSSCVMAFVGFIGMLSILNQSLTRYYNAIELIALHESAAKGFGTINRLITTKLSLARKDRGSPQLFIKYVSKENEKLFNDNIEPHHNSIKAFLDTFNTYPQDEVDFNFPDIVGKSFKIYILDNKQDISVDINQPNLRGISKSHSGYARNYTSKYKNYLNNKLSHKRTSIDRISSINSTSYVKKDVDPGNIRSIDPENKARDYKTIDEDKLAFDGVVFNLDHPDLTNEQDIRND